MVRTEGAGSGSSHLAWGAMTVLLLALAVGWLFVDVRRAQPAQGTDESAGESAGSPAEVVSRPVVAVTPRPALAGAAVEPEMGAEPEEVYVNQIDPGSVEKTGIHLFPRPGHKPIKGGILVPEGYQLPPGYMRHYQTTDDGELVGPILVFQPGYQPVDAGGRPIPLPADRVVPPELAPPGMTVRNLEPPPVRRDFEETSAPPR